MRIISKFKDYYDSILAYGQDSNFVYMRKQIEIDSFNKVDEDWLYDIKRNILPNISIHTVGARWRSYDNISDPFIIGFCGKIYPCVYLRYEYYCEHTKTTKADTIYAYSYSDVISFLKKHKLKNELQDFEEDSFFWNSKSQLKKFFRMKADDFQKIFVDYKIPIFKINFDTNVLDHPINIILNPQLSTYKFYQKVDAYTAFQEISMYLDGVLGVNAPETVDISDLMQRDKKGFDYRSFKKMPDNRRRKQKSGKVKKKR